MSAEAWAFVDVGLELLDPQDRFVEDISEWFQPDGSSVSSDVNQTIQRTATLNITRRLDWGRDRVRPYIVTASEHAKEYLTDDDGNVLTSETGQPLWSQLLGPDVRRTDLGIFTLGIPEEHGAEDPPTFTVSAFDKIELIHHALGQSVGVASGANYTDAILSVLQQLGVGPVQISQVSSSVLLPASRLWPVGTGVVGSTPPNELLAELGYRPLFVDREGVFRGVPDVEFSEQAPVATVSADVLTAGHWMSEDRTRVRDTWAPNRWVFVGTDGDSAWTHVVDDFADQAARGRVLPEEVQMSVIDEASLIERAERYAGRARRRSDVMQFAAFFIPELWHDDVIEVVDPSLDVAGLYRVTSWDLDLSSGEHTVSGVSA